MIIEKEKDFFPFPLNTKYWSTVEFDAVSNKYIFRSNILK
jgi:hypothetical protein